MHAKCDHSSISRSADMVGANQILNGSRDLTTPFQAYVSIHGLAFATINLSTKLEVFITTNYEDTKNDTK